MASRNRISRAISRCTPSRRVPHTPPARTDVPPPAGHAPLWVRAFTAIGRPVVAVAVLIMCAPGEHHLAVLAGWDSHLAWGMAAVLAAYAGIAAAVAGARPAGAPGKRSAVLGAVVSLGLAMSAQPVSHMFVTGHWSANPNAPEWLVWVVSCIPPLVLGHLLHLAATPIPRTGQAVSTQDIAVERLAAGRPAPWSPAALPLSVPVLVQPRRTPRPAPVQAPQDTQDSRAWTTSRLAAEEGVQPDTVRKWVKRGNVAPLDERDSNGGYLFAPGTKPKLAAVASA